jgi:hypothetical protein
MRMTIRGRIVGALAATAIVCVFGIEHSVLADDLPKTQSGSAEIPVAKPQIFKCEGSFSRGTSHARLAKEYGAANIDSEYNGEADANVTILFPKDPERRLIIQWKDEKGRQKPASITIEGKYWSAAGVVRRAPLVEVERLNGGPFKLNYFDADYGGAITDWMGGRLNAPFSSGCRVGVSIAVDEKLPEAIDKALFEEQGQDGSLPSSSAALRAAKPWVGELIVIYPK